MEVTKSDQAVLAKIWNSAYGFADSLVLKCGVDLEIADTIHKHGEPMTLSELVSQLPKQPVDIDRLYRIMRYLVQMKLFTKEISWQSGEIKYGLLPPAKFLIRAWYKSMVPTILTFNDKDFSAARLHLKDGLIDDCDPFEKAVGKNVWDYLSDNPVKNKEFNEAMASDSRLIASVLVNDCKHVFKGIKTLVDVGGGTGTMVKAISNAFPKIKCIVYDLPHVIANSSIDHHNSNIVCIEGDMFNFIPNADAILVKWILHDWPDNKCIQILKLCKEAIPQDGGKIIIVDIVLNMHSKHPYTKARLATDLDMLVSTGGGKERTEEEWKKLLEAAGFTGYKITEASSVQSVIEAFPC